MQLQDMRHIELQEVWANGTLVMQQKKISDYPGFVAIGEAHQHMHQLNYIRENDFVCLCG